MLRVYLSSSSGGATVCIQQLVFILFRRIFSGWIGFQFNQDITLVSLYTIISRCALKKT